MGGRREAESGRRVLRALVAIAAVLLGGVGGLSGVCGPFTDTANDAFCPFVLGIFSMGITTGTTATTFSPADNVNRLQMAAFLSRTVDEVLRRGGRRAALNQFWRTRSAAVLGATQVGTTPHFVKSDGADLWVSDHGLDVIVRVRASDGRVLETWTSGLNPAGILVATGRVFAAGNLTPGKLYMIDPSAAAGLVTSVATNLGTFPQALAYDGARIWSGDFGGSVSIITPGNALPWTVTTVTTGFSGVSGTIFDGFNVWVTDSSDRLFKLDGNGAILQTVTVGSGPGFPAFDGTNIWVPAVFGSSVTVVRASTGTVLATLTGNGLTSARNAAFDGQRV